MSFDSGGHHKGSTGENLLQLIESRLDNIVYRMGFASTRAEARQLVSHRAIEVVVQRKRKEGDKTITVDITTIVDIASFNLEPGNVVKIREKAKSQLRIKAAMELAQQRSETDWIEVEEKTMQGTYKRMPELDDLPAEYNVNLVVELYSK